MLNLYFKRAKIFLHTTKEGHSLRYNAVVSGANGGSPVPDWVKDTLTYKCGVKDKSIIDLTAPTAKPRPQAEIEEEAKAYVVGSNGADKDGAAVGDEDPDVPDDVVRASETDDEPAEKKAKKTAAKHGIK